MTLSIIIIGYVIWVVFLSPDDLGRVPLDPEAVSLFQEIQDPQATGGWGSRDPLWNQLIPLVRRPCLGGFLLLSSWKNGWNRSYSRWFLRIRWGHWGMVMDGLWMVYLWKSHEQNGRRVWGDGDQWWWRRKRRMAGTCWRRSTRPTEHLVWLETVRIGPFFSPVESDENYRRYYGNLIVHRCS